MVPGMGTFGDALARIRAGGMEEVLKQRVRDLRPTFFIGVGMQLLARSSEESLGVPGLCLLDTDVARLPSTVPAPPFPPFYYCNILRRCRCLRPVGTWCFLVLTPK